MLERDMFSAIAEDYKIIRWAVLLQYWKDYVEMELQFRGVFRQLRTGVLTQPSATNHIAQVNSVSTGTGDVHKGFPRDVHIARIKKKKRWNKQIKHNFFQCYDLLQWSSILVGMEVSSSRTAVWNNIKDCRLLTHFSAGQIRFVNASYVSSIKRQWKHNIRSITHYITYVVCSFQVRGQARVSPPRASCHHLLLHPLRIRWVEASVV